MSSSTWRSLSDACTVWTGRAGSHTWRMTPESASRILPMGVSEQRRISLTQVQLPLPPQGLPGRQLKLHIECTPATRGTNFDVSKVGPPPSPPPTDWLFGPFAYAK